MIRDFSATKQGLQNKKKPNKKWAIGCAFLIPNLKESGGEGDEESGGGPEEGTEGDDVGAVVAHGQVGGDRVARWLYYGPEESERAQARWAGVKRRTDLCVHTRQQRLVCPLHNPGKIHQNQSHRLRLHLSFSEHHVSTVSDFSFLFSINYMVFGEGKKMEE